MTLARHPTKLGYSDIRKAARLSVAPMMDWTDTL